MKRLIGIIIAALIIAVGVRTAIDEDSRRRNARADEEHAQRLAERTAERTAHQPPPKPSKLALPLALHALVDLPSEELTIPSEPWPTRELAHEGILLDTFSGQFTVTERLQGKAVLTVRDGKFTANAEAVGRDDEVRVHPEITVLDGSPDIRRIVAVRTKGGWQYGFVYESSFVSPDMPLEKWTFQKSDGLKDTVACWTTALRRGQRTERLVVSPPDESTKWQFRWDAQPIDLWVNGRKFEKNDSQAQANEINQILRKSSMVTIEAYLHADAKGDTNEYKEVFGFEFRLKK